MYEGLYILFHIANILIIEFLAALSSSRSLVVGWSVGLLVGLSVLDLCEKVTFRVSNGNCNLPKTYLPNYLPTRQ